MNKIRRDDKVSSFFYVIYLEPLARKNFKTDICVDENPILVSTSGSENFGFSFTGNSGMPGFGSGAARGDFTRNLDLGIRRWGLA